jgi:hypothetical protein
VRSKAAKAGYLIAVAVATTGWLWLLVAGAETIFGF